MLPVNSKDFIKSQEGQRKEKFHTSAEETKMGRNKTWSQEERSKKLMTEKKPPVMLIQASIQDDDLLF